MRDEIVQLVGRVIALPGVPQKVQAATPAIVGEEQPIVAPRTGVEVVEMVERKGTKYYTVKDLRNNNVVRNVTRTSARRLWRYAITEYETRPVQVDQVKWHGNIGLWKTYRRSGRKRYDFVQRDSNGKVHVYYGVTDDGIHGEWQGFIEKKE
jgi:hypothetical protein